MKKTCKGCRAGDQDVVGWGQIHYKCTLGYRIDGINRKPLEECPKPITYDEYLKIIKL